MVKLKKAITNQVSPDELKEKIDAIDNAPDEVEEETPETPEEETPEIVEDTPQEPVEDDFKEEVPEDNGEDKTDYKARYRGSTQEAQVLAAKNKEFVNAVDEASKLPEPTDEDMVKEYGDDWDMMDSVQKKMAKKTYTSERKFAIVNEAAQKTKKTEEWMDSVQKFTSDPVTVTKYPQLQGHEVEFEQFCSVPSRTGVNFDDLVKAFSFDIKPVRQQRKSLFEIKGGGEIAKPKELTPEEASYLRIHNQKKYKELVKRGKITFDL